jgi:hypothetical protein
MRTIELWVKIHLYFIKNQASSSLVELGQGLMWMILWFSFLSFFWNVGIEESNWLLYIYFIMCPYYNYLVPGIFCSGFFGTSYRQPYHLQRKVYFFLICIPFISFCCLIALARAPSTTTLKRNIK